MSELLPTVQAQRVQESITRYLTTTFALSDAPAREGLDAFLSDEETGIFKGPYIRLRAPFRPAAEGWRESLEWYEGFSPYGHQAAAFHRLSSIENGEPRRPQPTLVTTGTGSGKTEAFLYPILDHVLRARRHGVQGTKALILYPMNALANDQAERLTDLLTTYPALSHLTAGLYTGQDGQGRSRVSEEGLITERTIMRDEAPDILLTNYKMLDQLLLRREDQRIWEQSATSLQYLVLDEFHTYDGAQGTDVAMLLRRLGLALKSYWHAEEPGITEADRDRPLGKITPVATSATLGDNSDPTIMRGFAETVFGEPFDDAAIITESRLSLDQWTSGAIDEVAAAGLQPFDVRSSASDEALISLIEAVDELGADPAGADVARVVFSHLFVPTDSDDSEDGAADDVANLIGTNTTLLLALSKAHPIVYDVAVHASAAMSLDDLAAVVAPPSATTSQQQERWRTFLHHMVAALGHVRSETGRSALTIDVHFWVRELSRIDRAAASHAEFRWSDEGPVHSEEGVEELRPAFPAIYCRQCGRSGWQVGLAPVGQSLGSDDSTIRRDRLMGEGRSRDLLYAAEEADAAFFGDRAHEGLRWFSVRQRELLTTMPEPDDPELLEGWILPVLTTVGRDADAEAHKERCPSCGQEDSIRFLGSSIATLLSVSLTTLFGSGQLGAAEKKALVFTDSVQDAAHRAGFIDARSHTFTLRAALREAVAAGALSLEELVAEVMRQAGDDSFARYRILAPDCADRDSFAEYWQAPTAREVGVGTRNRVRKRLAFDAAMEFGLASRLGRTLELTGSLAVEVDAGPPATIATLAHRVLEGFALHEAFDAPFTDETLVAWIRGILRRMRDRGAITHPWLQRFRERDGQRYLIWGGRRRDEGMPAFPYWRSAPAFPQVGGNCHERSLLDPVTEASSWYARWTAQALPVSSRDGARLVRLLLQQLAKTGVLDVVTSEGGAQVYGIPPANIIIAPPPLRQELQQLECTTCHAITPGGPTTINQLTAAPCLLAGCPGHLQPAPVQAGFYRRLYASPDMRRIVSREHTGLLDSEVRQKFEDGFKQASTTPQAPNVLVATPTLEMGIDIGDLSAILLASLPRSVASYLQRVGRAGRQSGNALSLAFLTGRGEQLPKLGEPLSVINGDVRPPATYLQAEEILRRQYIAHLIDELARDTSRPQPRTAPAAIGSAAEGTFLAELIEHAEHTVEQRLVRFLAAFPTLPDEVGEALRAWLTPLDGAGTSALAAHVVEASTRWQQTVETLRHRLDDIDALLPQLQQQAASPASSEEDERALRSAKVAKKLATGHLAHLRSDYWIMVLEEYGLLPNYTLLDDDVVLDVGIGWIDPDTGQYDTNHHPYHRGSSQALRDFAPGAVFYAEGREIHIDAVDLGTEAEAIRPWAFCADCGYGSDLIADGAEVQPTQCPRCGSRSIADTGQRLEVVELQRATAEIRRDESAISDHNDTRQRTGFEIVTAADVTAVGRQWFASNTGLGCTYVPRMTLRWLNLGRRGHGTTHRISGEERAGSLFRVCRGCGKLDKDPDGNSPSAHRPWCRYRTAAEGNTSSIALSRTLNTQGLLLRLPRAITLGDDFAIPSLATAVLLGLREQLGGQPDHLDVTRGIDPNFSDGSNNHEAILLHDTVPGGTGYLTDMSDPAKLRTLLQLAHQLLRDCPCRHEDRLACHRCLLPLAAPHDTPRVSRAVAERHLQALLYGEGEQSATQWHLTETPPPEETESHLEQHFRVVLRDRLETLGAKITERPGAWANQLDFTLPGGTRRWSLTPQERMLGSRPDFVLASNDPNIPKVVIFTDGHAYHATRANNALSDDATKRRALRNQGHIVLGVTARDVENAATSEEAVAPAWLADDKVKKVINHPAFYARPESYKLLRHGPVEWLTAWVQSPDPTQTQAVARATPSLLAGEPTESWVAHGVQLASVAAAVVSEGWLPAVPSGPRRVPVYRRGALAIAVEYENSRFHVAVVLDDRAEVMDTSHREAWREWLSLSNALALRDWPTDITTTSLVADPGVHLTEPATEPAAGLDGEVQPSDGAELSDEWQEALEETMSDAEANLLKALANHERSAEIAAPTIGAEGPDGIPLSFAWPEARLAADSSDFSDTDRADLTQAGWQIVVAEPEQVVTALLGRGASEVV